MELRYFNGKKYELAKSFRFIVRQDETLWAMAREILNIDRLNNQIHRR